MSDCMRRRGSQEVLQETYWSCVGEWENKLLSGRRQNLCRHLSGEAGRMEREYDQRKIMRKTTGGEISVENISGECKEREINECGSEGRY